MKQNSISNLGPIDVPFLWNETAANGVGSDYRFNSPGLVSRDIPGAVSDSFVVSSFPGRISGAFDTICSSCSVSIRI
jgi:hypothetical protein